MTTLKQRVTTIDDVDEQYRGLYQEDEESGEHVLTIDVEGMVPKTKLNEFRRNSTAHQKKAKELEDQLSAFEGIDPDEWRKEKEELENLRVKVKAGDGGNIDELLQQRTKDMREAHNKQVNALAKAKEDAEKKTKDLHNKLGGVTIESELTRAVNTHGAIRSGAHDDVRHRALRDWSIDDDGDLTPRDGMTDIDGEPITSMDQYAPYLIHTAPHLFEAGGGGGAGGGKGKDNGGGGIRRLKRGSRLSEKDIQDIAAGKAALVD